TGAPRGARGAARPRPGRAGADARAGRRRAGCRPRARRHPARRDQRAHRAARRGGRRAARPPGRAAGDARRRRGGARGSDRAGRTRGTRARRGGPSGRRAAGTARRGGGGRGRAAPRSGRRAGPARRARGVDRAPARGEAAAAREAAPAADRARTGLPRAAAGAPGTALMKARFLLHQFLPRHVTGTEQYARSVARELIRRGNEVEIFAFEPLIQFEAPPDTAWFARSESVDGIPVQRISLHPDPSPNPPLADYENPIAGRLFARHLAAGGFDLVHVFHARNVGTDAIAAPRALGVPVVVNLMDFWFLCPNFMLLRRNGDLCQGPPEGGLGCVPCMDP